MHPGDSGGDSALSLSLITHLAHGWQVDGLGHGQAGAQGSGGPAAAAATAAPASAAAAGATPTAWPGRAAAPATATPTPAPTGWGHLVRRGVEGEGGREREEKRSQGFSLCVREVRFKMCA